MKAADGSDDPERNEGREGEVENRHGADALNALDGAHSCPAPS